MGEHFDQLLGVGGKDEFLCIKIEEQYIDWSAVLPNLRLIFGWVGWHSPAKNWELWKNGACFLEPEKMEEGEKEQKWTNQQGRRFWGKRRKIFKGPFMKSHHTICSVNVPFCLPPINVLWSLTSFENALKHESQVKVGIWSAKLAHQDLATSGTCFWSTYCVPGIVSGTEVKKTTVVLAPNKWTVFWQRMYGKFQWEIFIWEIEHQLF